MHTKLLPGANPSGPRQTGAQRFGDWLTVSDAVVYCSMQGLSRTPKTIRKWAHLSHRDDGQGDLMVRREDVDNGFRWSIERASLERKVKQELEFEARRTLEHGEPLQTGLDMSEPARTIANAGESEDANRSSVEQVPTSANLSGAVGASSVKQTDDEPDTNRSEPAHTRAGKTEGDDADPNVIRQLEARIDDLKSEVAFYRDELRDRRNTAQALTDVIETFRLTAASNANRSHERSERRSHDIVRPGDEGDKWQGDERGNAV